MNYNGTLHLHYAMAGRYSHTHITFSFLYDGMLRCLLLLMREKKPSCAATKRLSSPLRTIVPNGFRYRYIYPHHFLKRRRHRHHSGFYCIMGFNITVFPPFPPVDSMSSSPSPLAIIIGFMIPLTAPPELRLVSLPAPAALAGLASAFA